MENPPLVSIIIPTWNTASYVREAVDSALAQTYQNCEVIVVDDGSTDNTKAVLGPYISAKRITYMYQANTGLSGARNTGIKASHGEFIALLDSDDVFLPEKIAEQVAYLTEHPACDVSYCNLFHFWDGEQALLRLNYEYYSGDDVLPHLLHMNFIAPLSVVLRRSVIERFGMFDENLKRSEDLEFWLRLAHGGARFEFLPKRLAKLRMRKTANLQGVESQPKVKETMLEVLERVSATMTPEERARVDMRKYQKRYRLNLGLAYLMNARTAEAKPHILGAFAEYSFGTVLGWLAWLPFAMLPAGFVQKTLAKLYYRRRALRLSEIDA
jgi:glycosyltransferase involved in cell wall biosynthesis